VTGVETPQAALRRVEISAGPLVEQGFGAVQASSAAVAFVAAVVAVVDAVAVAAVAVAAVAVVVVDEFAADVDVAVLDGRSHAASAQARVHDADLPSYVGQIQPKIGVFGALPGPAPLPPS